MHDFDFVKLVDEKFTHISFSKKIQNNNHTPLEVYKKFPKKNSFLFESALHGGKWSRYSIIGLESSELRLSFGPCPDLKLFREVANNFIFREIKFMLNNS